MLLYLSTGRDRVRRSQGSEQLPGDVALECAHDLLRGAAFGPAACDIGAGGGIDSHADDRDRRERAIQTPIAAAGISGNSASSTRISGSKESTAEPRGDRT